MLVQMQWRIQDLPWGGYHGERAEREPKRGSGSRGLVVGEAESFFNFYAKKVAKY